LSARGAYAAPWGDERDRKAKRPRHAIIAREQDYMLPIQVENIPEDGTAQTAEEVR
jgi:hypothetical protein